MLRPLFEALRQPAAAPTAVGADTTLSCGTVSHPTTPGPVRTAGDPAEPAHSLGGGTEGGGAMAEARAAGRARVLRRYAEDQLALLAPFAGQGLVEEDLRAPAAARGALYPDRLGGCV